MFNKDYIFLGVRILNYKKSYSVKSIGVLIGLAVVSIGVLIKIGLIAYAGIILIAGSWLQAIIFCRCPRCKKNLVTGDKMPKHCPECGYKLDD